MMSEAPRPRVKRILVGSRVSGQYGEFLPIPEAVRLANPDKRHHRVKERLFGFVKAVVDQHKYLVHFDNGTELECFANNLRVKAASASLPPFDGPPHPIPPPRVGELDLGPDPDSDDQDNEPENPTGD